MPEKGAFLRVKVATLVHHPGRIGEEDTVWFACPVCQHTMRVTKQGPSRGLTHFGPGCRVRFDLVTDECLIPVENVPRAVALRLRGANA